MSETLLPSSASIIERAMELATARIEAVPAPTRYMWSPQNAPAQLLPWLAWAFSVDTWDTTWTEAQKRATIAASYSVHRRKGTVGAVRRALAALGLGITIVEWWQETPQGEPYTFRISVDVDQTGAPPDAISKVLEVLNTSKNLRSHLNSVDLNVTSYATPFLAAVTAIGNEITIFPET